MYPKGIILDIHKQGFISAEHNKKYPGIHFEWQKFDNKLLCTKIREKLPPLNHKVFIRDYIRINNQIVEPYFYVRRFKHDDDGSEPYFCWPSTVHLWCKSKYISKIDYRCSWAEIPEAILNSDDFVETIYIYPATEMRSDGRYYVSVLHGIVIHGHSWPDDDVAKHNLNGLPEAMLKNHCPQGFKIEFRDEILDLKSFM